MKKATLKKPTPKPKPRPDTRTTQEIWNDACHLWLSDIAKADAHEALVKRIDSLSQALAAVERRLTERQDGHLRRLIALETNPPRTVVPQTQVWQVKGTCTPAEWSAGQPRLFASRESADSFVKANGGLYYWSISSPIIVLP